MLGRLAMALIAVAVAASVDAATIRVPEDQPTVRAGIAAAATGDTVLIACGIYQEHGIPVTAGITLRGASDPHGCVILDAQGLSFALQISTPEPVAVEGITFTHGSLSGIDIVGPGTSVFRRCAWRDNTGFVGGGVRASRNAQVGFEECHFEGNAVTGSGGALQNVTTVVNCIFLSNTAASGGGGAIAGAEVVEGCVFRENAAAAGGAIVAGRNTTRASIVGSTFTSNKTAGAGGAVAFQAAVGTIQDCRFVGNSAVRGGAIHLERAEDASAVYGIWTCSFSRNLAADGGALWVASNPLESPTYATVYDSDFFRNEAGVFGGAIATEMGSITTVQQCTFAGNVAGSDGSAIAVGPAYFRTQLTVRGSILAFSPRGVPVSTQGGRLGAFECNDVFGNVDGDFVGILGSLGGRDGNFSLNPLFCGLTEELLYIASGSPCLLGNHPDGWTCGQIGAFGEGCGQAARMLALEPATWGRIKAGYR